MSPSRRGVLLLSVIITGGILLGACLAPAQETGSVNTQASMRGIFRTLTTAYTYSLDGEAFQSPENHAKILTSLQALAADANALDQHGGGLDPSFEYLRRSLARDAAEALQRFEQRQYIGSQFSLAKMTENCVACHSKLPRRKRFDIGVELAGNPEIQKLPPVERVDIEIATRQFETALDTYEEIFRAADTTPSKLALVGAFEGYLKICIAVLNDTERPVRALGTFAQRTDMPTTLKQLVTGWIYALENLNLQEARGNELPVARDFIKDAEVQMRFPADRTGLVDLVASAALLHRYLQAEPSDEAGIAEAYYLLAVAESYITRSFWVSETAFLLEKSIRQAPKSTFAARAFAFLEEYTMTAHAREAGPLPEGVEQNLAELRRMIEE
jgi:hypothetical protein